MNIDQFNRKIVMMQRKIETFTNVKMPVLAANIAIRHIREDFRKGGFTNNGFTKWDETKRQKTGGKSASSKYGPLLSGRLQLFNSFNKITGPGTVTIYTDLSYAAVHNNGGVTHPRITPKMRKFAWAMYYKETGIKPGMKRGGKARKKRMANESDTAKQWKGLALTKKNSLNIKIPKRQFMPTVAGKELMAKINAELDKGINNILKL